MKKRLPRWTENEVTEEALFLNRRSWLKQTGVLGIAGWLGRFGLAPPKVTMPPALPAPSRRWNTAKGRPTPFESIATYNNFYEFGTGKSDPAREGRGFRSEPWRLVIDGECARPRVYGIEDLRRRPLEERIYRHRCVEAWSMVVPWTGLPLASLLRDVEPLASARYVSFTTVLDPAQMPGQRSDVLSWPYLEGLRMDEALHPLTLLALGVYGHELPPQNGAPVRLVVPWKYGFKGAKSLVRISLVRSQPLTTWMRAVPERYGFYSNVNPQVDRVPWSQAYERRIGDLEKRPTQIFNGYGNEVASLYRGMDLTRYY